MRILTPTNQFDITTTTVENDSEPPIIDQITAEDWDAIHIIENDYYYSNYLRELARLTRFGRQIAGNNFKSIAIINNSVDAMRRLLDINRPNSNDIQLAADMHIMYGSSVLELGFKSEIHAYELFTKELKTLMTQRQYAAIARLLVDLAYLFPDLNVSDFEPSDNFWDLTLKLIGDFEDYEDEDLGIIEIVTVLASMKLLRPDLWINTDLLRFEFTQSAVLATFHRYLYNTGNVQYNIGSVRLDLILAYQILTAATANITKSGLEMRFESPVPTNELPNKLIY